MESIRLRGGEQTWKIHGYCWIDIEEDGGAFDPLDVVRTIEQAIDKNIHLYADPVSAARLKARQLDRLELLVHGGFNLYAYNTPNSNRFPWFCGWATRLGVEQGGPLRGV